MSILFLCSAYQLKKTKSGRSRSAIRSAPNNSASASASVGGQQRPAGKIQKRKESLAAFCGGRSELPLLKSLTRNNGVAKAEHLQRPHRQREGFRRGKAGGRNIPPVRPLRALKAAPRFPPPPPPPPPPSLYTLSLTTLFRSHMERLFHRKIQQASQEIPTDTFSLLFLLSIVTLSSLLIS